jgi:hypothetical protein
MSLDRPTSKHQAIESRVYQDMRTLQLPDGLDLALRTHSFPLSHA